MNTTIAHNLYCYNKFSIYLDIKSFSGARQPRIALQRINGTAAACLVVFPQLAA
jgi:hypothetical protein